MCGIAGFSRQLFDGEVQALHDALRHRGPDRFGQFQDERYSFFHWRLSIIDLSEKGNQPYTFGNLVLLYNGEIYNYEAVRAELERSGYDFQSNSDTEVLIKAFHRWGVRAVDRFIGMFAFSIYNTESGELFLVRDRMGVKPLYYSFTQNGLAFASEIRALRQARIPGTLDDLSLHQYFRFGFVPGERTIFNHIKKVPPGHVVHLKDGVLKVKSYWQIPAPTGELPASPDTERELHELLISAFRYRLVADVPVGVFLSGGVDSSLLAAILQHHGGQRIKTFTIGFDDPAYDESPFARQVARQLDTEHTDIHVGIGEAQHLFEKFYDLFDEPFSDTSAIPTALVAKLAKENGAKVVLSADGGDELFGGYPHYPRVDRWHRTIGHLPQWLAQLDRLLPADYRQWAGSNLGHRLDRVRELLSADTEVEFFESAVANQTHAAINELMGRQFAPAPLLSNRGGVFLEMMMHWDSRFYLPDDLLMKVDRATMFSSIEGREPLLDHRVVEFAQRLALPAKINHQAGKQILRNILFQYLPEGLFNRPKQGFSIPIFEWFVGQLDVYFEEFLQPQRIRQTGILNAKAVEAELLKYRRFKQKGQPRNMEKMWRLLSFMMWHKKWA